jgi:hypothetical protein
MSRSREDSQVPRIIVSRGDDAFLAFLVDLLPFREVFPLGGYAAYPTSGAVGEDDNGIIPEKLRNGILIITKIIIKSVFESLVGRF